MKTETWNHLLLASLTAGLCFLLTGRVSAQTFTALHSFTVLITSEPNHWPFYYPTLGVNNDGAEPKAGLVLSGNTLYGTAYCGGANAAGTVFAVNTDGTSFTTVDNLPGPPDAYFPTAGLYLSGNTLYGTSEGYGSLSYGGGNGPVYGTVFAVNTGGTAYATLTNFTPSEANTPFGGVVLSGNTLYGTAEYGGGYGEGTVFAVNTDGTGYTNLYNFTDGSDGAFPKAGLILSGNTLYGTAYVGGSSGNGTVFKVNTDGTGFTTLHSFTARSGSPPANSDGANPQSGLILSGNTLFGTAEFGGSSGNGTVFAVNTDGTSFTTLHNFTVRSPANSDGANPQSGLILSGNTLFGTAEFGGSSGNGTVFAVNTDGTSFTTLYSFTSFLPASYDNSDGANPVAGLILSGNTLYGTAYRGGSSGNGTVFSLSVEQIIIAASSVCANSTGNIASCPASQISYSWTISGGTITSGATAQTVTYTAGASGNVVLTLTVPTGNTSVTIPINPLPATPTITSAPASVCANSTGNTASGPDGSSSYAWMITGGTITAGATGQTVTYTAAASGSVVLTLTVLNASGCSANNSATIPIFATPPAPVISGASSVCSDSIENNASGPAGATSYAWTITGGSITAGNNAQTVTYTAGDSGNVVLGLTVANAAGCTAFNSATITINVAPQPNSNALGTSENTAVTVPAAGLLANDPSLVNVPLSIINVTPNSTQGGTVALAGGLVTYTPPNGFTGEDYFNYTLSDGNCINQGTVKVGVSTPNEPSFNNVSIRFVGTCVLFSYKGTQAQQYVLQSAPTPSGPWTDFSPDLTADATGLVTFTDCDIPGALNLYFRARTGP